MMHPPAAGRNRGSVAATQGRTPRPRGADTGSEPWGRAVCAADYFPPAASASSTRAPPRMLIIAWLPSWHAYSQISPAVTPRDA